MDNPETILESMLNGITSGNKVTLTALDSTDADLDKLINDNIYGLLSKVELSVEDITLLSALLSNKSK